MLWFTPKKLDFIVLEHNKTIDRFTTRAKFSDQEEATWYCKNALRNLILFNNFHITIRLINARKKQEIDLWGDFEPPSGNKTLIDVLGAEIRYG